MARDKSAQLPPANGLDTSVFEGMIAGKPYYAGDPYVKKVADQGRARVTEINAEHDGEKRTALFKKYGAAKTDTADFYIALPFFTEYVFNLEIGDQVYVGPGCTFLDVTDIKVGDRTLIGPSCHIYTPGHPILPEERKGTKGPEWASPIEIGEDCWLGGNVTLIGPLRIGAGSTIGAGAVVTKDVPPRSVVVGNPGRVVKTLPLPEEKKEEKAV